MGQLTQPTLNHKDATTVRNFYKLRRALSSLQESIAIIDELALDDSTLEEMTSSNRRLDKLVGISSTMDTANLLKTLIPSINDIFNSTDFEAKKNELNEYIKYPVVSDENLEQLAFIHKSYTSMNVNLTEEQKIIMSNERLEFLGDSWLGALVSYILYIKYPTANEGALSKMKEALVSNANLYEWSDILGFRRRLQNNIPATSMRIKEKISKRYADCVEAYIGALVVDRFGNEFKDMTEWLSSLSDKKLDVMSGSLLRYDFNKNAKNELGLYLQANKLGAKIFYKRLSDSSPFTVEVYLGDVLLGRGVGSNNKEAEHRAAMEALSNRATLQKYSNFSLEDRFGSSTSEIQGTSGAGYQSLLDNASILSGSHDSSAFQIPSENSITQENISDIDMFEEHDNNSSSVEQAFQVNVDTLPANDAYQNKKNNISQTKSNTPSVATTNDNQMNGMPAINRSPLSEDKKDELVSTLMSEILGRVGKVIDQMAIDLKTNPSVTKNTNVNSHMNPHMNTEFKNVNPQIDNTHSSPIDVPNDKNAMETLYKMLTKEQLYPEYTVESVGEGFKSVCTVMGVGTFLGEGTGRSKKFAKNNSAKDALRKNRLNLPAKH